MKTLPFQNWLDKKIEKYLLFLLPKKITPNILTVIRFALIPFIYLLLSNEYYFLGTICFAAAALTDAMDGALARTKNQITEIGKVLDPIADKLLIGIALFVIGFEYLIVKVFLVFIALEIITVISGYFLAHKIGKPLGANIYGKIKMVLQSFSVGFLLLGIILNKNELITLTEAVLFAALIFALLAALKSSKDKLRQLKSKS